MEYNPLADKNELRIRDVFICIDQIEKYSYMINVIDNTGKISYTRKEIKQVCDFQLDQLNSGVCFIGQVRKNGYTPGYFF
jgi:hypothetical protein